MWPFKRKRVNIQPGETKDLAFEISENKEIGDIGEIVLNYSDKYGNKYETRAMINIKEKKIISQSYDMIEKVKDIPEKDRPKLVVDEKYLK